jgi:hypothetical protein
LAISYKSWMSRGRGKVRQRSKGQNMSEDNFTPNYKGRHHTLLWWRPFFISSLQGDILKFHENCLIRDGLASVPTFSWNICTMVLQHSTGLHFICSGPLACPLSYCL